MKFNVVMGIKCEEDYENKNLKEYPSGKQIKKASHWANRRHFIPFHFSQILNRRVFFWIFDRKINAALTVEAAFAVPIFILALSTLLGVMDCYRIQSLVKMSIHQSALELGMYAYAENEENLEVDIVDSAICIAYAKSRLPELGENVSVSLLGSCYKDNKVSLVATIKYTLPISLFPISTLKFINTSEVYSWVGNSSENYLLDVKYPMVYVCDYESVYHTSVSCSHINITIYESKKFKLEKKYDPCEKCCKNQEIESREVVYYTETGDCYHLEKTCSSLKRTVRLVEFAQVNNLPICGRCESRGEA